MDEPAVATYIEQFFDEQKSMDETDLKTLARDLSVLLENYRDPDVDKEEINVLMKLQNSYSLLERRNKLSAKTMIEITNFLCSRETVNSNGLIIPKIIMN